MPKVRTDWIEVIVDAGEPTTGWQVMLDLRVPNSSGGGNTPAILKLSTGAGTLQVGLPTVNGPDFGIGTNVPKSMMNFTPRNYVFDVKRIDGGRDEDLVGTVDYRFDPPISEQGVA